MSRRSDMSTCAVIGAAAGVRHPDLYHDHYIYANGAIILGPRTPFTWATTSLFFSRHPKHLQRAVHIIPKPLSILVDTTDGKVSDVSDNIDCEHFGDITPARRDRITYNACGLHVGAGDVGNRVSTGLFALCVALLEFEFITICGLSLEAAYCNEYKIQATSRGHMPADKDCLDAIARLHASRLRTTSQELHNLYGIELC